MRILLLEDDHSLGSDTAAATEAVAAAHLALLKDWRTVAVSTDFPTA